MLASKFIVCRVYLLLSHCTELPTPSRTRRELLLVSRVFCVGILYRLRRGNVLIALVIKFTFSYKTVSNNAVM